MPKIPNSSNATSVNLQGATSSRQSLNHRQAASRISSQSDPAALTTNTQQTPTISAQQTNQRGISSATNEVPPSSTSEQNQLEANTSDFHSSISKRLHFNLNHLIMLY